MTASAANPWVLGLAGSSALAVALHLLAQGAAPGEPAWSALARLAVNANLLVAAAIAAAVAGRRAGPR